MCRVLLIYSLLIHESPFRNMPLAQRQAQITRNTTTLHRKHGTLANIPLAGDTFGEKFAFLLDVVVTSALRQGGKRGKSCKGTCMGIEQHLVTLHCISDKP